MKLKKLFIALVLLPISGWAQMGGHGGGGMNDGQDHGQERHGHHGTDYDLANVVTLQGIVMEIGGDSRGHHGKKDGMGSFDMGFYRIDLLTDDEREIELMVAPLWYIDREGYEFEVGQSLVVTGSLPPMDEDHGDDLTMMVAVIQTDNQTIVFRDELGYPVWMGTGPHPMGFADDYSGLFAYMPESETILDGLVTRIDVTVMEPGTHPTVQILVEADGVLVTSVLAPFWFYNRQDTGIEIGQHVTMAGAYFESELGQFFLVRLMTQNESTSTWRDDQGWPLWTVHRD